MRTSDRRSGFIMVTMICSLVGLVALLGLAVDVGYQEYVKTRMQAAADAAAIGAAEELRAAGSSNVVTAAKADAAANGFTDGQQAVTVRVNNPPATGFSTSDSNAVEILISQTVPTFFMVVLGFSSGTVQARSVAKLGNSSACIFALNPAASGTFGASGSILAQFSCGLLVNSSSASGITASGGATVAAASIGVAGGYSTSGGSSLTPAPVIGILPEYDPLARLAKPAVGACGYSKTKINSDTTLSAGVYCDGISISGGAAVHFNPGTYILLGGGIKITGGGSLTGTGVTLFNTGNASYSYGGFDISGSTAINLSAPTTGNLAGILFFQDPAVGAAGGSKINGDSTSIINGALYFPTTSLDFSGGAAGQYTILIADTISITGNSNVKSDYSSLPGGSPVRSGAILSE